MDVASGLQAGRRRGLKAAPYREERYGNDSKDREGSQGAEVQNPAAQPLRLCGRPRAYMRKFALCRLCFRKLALDGDVTGVTKSSW